MRFTTCPNCGEESEIRHNICQTCGEEYHSKKRKIESDEFDDDEEWFEGDEENRQGGDEDV
jgi:uncharacterized membrane protein YvbJ